MQMPLGDLELFAVVARTRSFRRAGQELGMAVSTLSERLRALEEKLGVRLLNRTTRSVSATEAGAHLLQHLGPALGEIREAISRLGDFSDQPTGTLRINAPGAATRLVLAPMIGGFLRAHPRITLEIIEQDAMIDIVADGYDAGVRFGESLAQDMIAVSLGPPMRYAIAAAPRLLAKEGAPKAPRDLLGKPCIRHRFSSGAVLPWEFEKDGKTVVIQPEGPLISNDMTIERQAAIDGAGFLMTFEHVVRDDIKAGRLVEVLRDWCPEFPGPYLYYPSRRHMPAALRAFIDYLRERLA
ncbi:MAG TPA: LysR family transcriptional regulator [Alphaproteobacteria bacterium]|nr:LysR family transcriptional regulator [Alphaproteobacteria bacterium]